MKGYDAFVAREHSRAFNAGPICRHCGCEEEVHCVGCKDAHTAGSCKRLCLECDRCEGYEARDPRDDENDDPGYYEE